MDRIGNPHGGINHYVAGDRGGGTASLTSPEHRSRPEKLLESIARGVCLVIALYFLAFACLALLQARDFASAPPQFIRYVAVPAVIGLTLLLCALRARRRTAAVVGIWALAIMAAALAVELVIAVRMYSGIAGLISMPSAQWLHTAGVDHALPPSRTAKGINTQLKVKHLDQALLSNIPGERTLLCTSNGAPVIYRTDRYGFRNADSIYGSPPSLLLLGDSFVEGLCQGEAESLVARVRDRNPSTVGIGHRGAGPLMELAMLGRFGSVIRPKTVAMVFYEGNDWTNLENEQQQAYLREALSPGAKFGPAILPAALAAQAQRPIASWIAKDSHDIVEVARRTSTPRNVLALNHVALALGIAYPKVVREQPVYSRILGRARDLVGSWGGKLVLVYIPDAKRFRGLLKHESVYDQIRFKVRDAAAQNDIQFIDLTDVTRQQPDPDRMYSATDGHYSGVGSDIAGQTILRALSSNSENDTKVPGHTS